MTKGEKQGLLIRMGARLAIARDISGLTQHQLSARSGIGRCQIANLEAGRSDMPVTTLVRLARGLGVNPKVLLP